VPGVGGGDRLSDPVGVDRCTGHGNQFCLTAPCVSIVSIQRNCW
jgi:hypothetical protein